jgi:hypothetical protein
MLKHFASFTQDKDSPGPIIVSQDLDIGQAIEEILIIWAATEAEELANVALFVPL